MKLHEQVAELKQELATMRQGVLDVMKYLQSEKFHNDTTVQTSDMLRRLQDDVLNATADCTTCQNLCITGAYICPSYKA